MAKLHSGKKGKSGTKRPKAKASNIELEVKKEDMKSLILKLVKEDMPPSKIGIMLRDKYGVPSPRALFGMSMNKFLKTEKILPEYPEDILSLIKKAVRLRNHLKNFKSDIHNRVKLSHIESKINRLAKYYVGKRRLPEDWKYDPEKAALLVK